MRSGFELRMRSIRSDDTCAKPFREHLRGVALNPPSIPFYSNVTGKLISDSEATDPEYWVKHLRFASAVRGLHERFAFAPGTRASGDRAGARARYAGTAKFGKRCARICVDALRAGNGL